MLENFGLWIIVAFEKWEKCWKVDWKNFDINLKPQVGFEIHAIEEDGNHGKILAIN